VTSIFQRGVARGEFRNDVDADVAMDMIFAPIIYRLLTGHAPLSRQLAKNLVDAALNGLAQPHRVPGVEIPHPTRPRRSSQ